MNNQEQRTVAICAVVQAAYLVEQLARTGDFPKKDAEPLIKGLFVTDPDDFNDIFGAPVPNIQTGLETLRTLASGKNEGISPDVTRYVVAILHQESKLRRNKGMMSSLGGGIQNASRQVEHFGLLHTNSIAALADVYKETLSNLSFRIHVTGNPTYLQNEETASWVRALLLSGLRAAILWRQVGGRRWQLLIQRKRYTDAIDSLLR